MVGSCDIERSVRQGWPLPSRMRLAIISAARPLEYLPWLSSEERASEWALTDGLPMVFGVRRAEIIARQGAAQLKAIGLLD